MKTTPDFPKRSLANRMIAISCLTVALGLVACQQEGSAEKAGQKIDKALDNIGQKMEQTTEEADKKMDSVKESVVQQAEKTGAYIDDSVITTQIKAAMINDEFLKASAIEVTTVNGVVTLKGTVDSEQLVGRAIGLANSQQGVKSVQNELMTNASVSSKQ
jgi:hyperosmotically inducible protein